MARVHDFSRELKFLYPHWQREVGLVELRQKPTLIVRSQPLRPIEKKFVGALLEYYAGQAEQAVLAVEELDLCVK